jgi:IS605 OrfB family transposase
LYRSSYYIPQYTPCNTIKLFDITSKKQSWFDIKYTDIPNPQKSNITKVTIENTFIRTYKIMLYPTQLQLNIIKLWLDDVIDLYNITVTHINNIIKPLMVPMIANRIIIDEYFALSRYLFATNCKLERLGKKKIVPKKAIQECNKLISELVDEQKKLLPNFEKANKKNYDIFKKIRKVLKSNDICKALNPQINKIKDVNNCDRHTLDGSVCHCVSMFKSAFTNFYKRHIPNFEIKHLLKTKNRKQLIVEKQSISKKYNTIFKNQLGKHMESSRKLKDFRVSECTLQYNALQDTMYLLCPMRIAQKIMYLPKEPTTNCTKTNVKAVKTGVKPITQLINNIQTNRKAAIKVKPKTIVAQPIINQIAQPIVQPIVPKKKFIKNKDPHRIKNAPTYEREEKCGIDMGLRTFLSCYDGVTALEICNSNVSYPIINNYIKNIDSIVKLHNEKKITDEKYKKVHTRLQNRMKNRIRDMHDKAASFLVKKYNVINIGNISVKGILSRENNMSEINKRICTALSLYSFRERLKMLGKKHGCQVNVVREYLTSKLCSNCDAENDPGMSKVYKCESCKMVIDRDINAAKNIWKK